MATSTHSPAQAGDNDNVDRRELLSSIGNAANRMRDHLQLLAMIKEPVLSELLAHGADIGDRTVEDAASQLLSIVRLAERDIGATIHFLGGVHNVVWEWKYASRRRTMHPLMATANRKWDAALAAYSATTAEAEVAVTEGSDCKIDANAELASRALAALIDTPAPGLPALRQKLEIILKEDVSKNEGVAAAIFADIDQLTRASEGKVAWMDSPAAASAAMVEA